MNPISTGNYFRNTTKKKSILNFKLSPFSIPFIIQTIYTKIWNVFKHFGKNFGAYPKMYQKIFCDSVQDFQKISGIL